MAANTIGSVVLLVMCLVATHCQARKIVLLSGSSVTSITKTSRSVCKVSVLCQVSLTNSASSIILGSTPICSSSGSRETTVTVGSAKTIPVTVNLIYGDYYRAIIIELFNTCSDETVDPVCDESPSETFGLILYPSEDESKYGPNLKCVYIFAAKTGYCGLKLEFKKFDLQTTEACKADNLTIGSKSFCGDQLKHKTGEYELPLTMTFASNDDDESGAGFKAIYSYEKQCTDCNKKESKLSGRIKPPSGIDEKYKKNMVCTFEVQKYGDMKCVRFMFTSLEDMSGSGDTIEIDGVPTKNKLDGSDELPLEISTLYFPDDGRPIDVVFRSDDADANDKPDAYTITYQQLDSDDDDKCGPRPCKPIFHAERGILTNPEDPESTSNPKIYPKNFECQYTIKKAANMAKVEIFVTPSLADTGEKFNVTDAKGGKQLQDGKATTLEYDTGKTEIHIKFTSDGNVEKPFTMIVSQLA